MWKAEASEITVLSNNISQHILEWDMLRLSFMILDLHLFMIFPEVNKDDISTIISDHEK